MTCIIKIDRKEIDVEQIYKVMGFEKLPPQLTMTIDLMRRRGNVQSNYTIVKAGKPIDGDGKTAISVTDGDWFVSIPPVHY